MSEVTFQAVARGSTLTRLIIDQIETMISERHIHPGDRLPSERDLAQQFNVSRTVIREAVSALAAKSLLEPQFNGGAIVRSPSAESVSKSFAMYFNTTMVDLDYQKVHEVRRLLEVEIASLAAIRRTEADLALLTSVVDKIADPSLSRQEFAAYDVEFHSALAQATKNELFILLLDSMSRVLLQVRERAFALDGTAQRAHKHHSEILAAVRSSDSESAVEAMNRHLFEAEETQARVGTVDSVS